MKLFLLTIFIALASFVFQSCSGCKNSITPTPDNPYGLPNATQSGANVFACRVNGQNFIVGQWLGLNAGIINKDTLDIVGEPKTNRYFHKIFLQINKALQQGKTYSIDSVNNLSYYGTDSTCLGIGSNVLTVPAISGSITLTRLSGTSEILNGTYNPNTIVSGTFNLIFVITNCDTLKVTDGRFDINYSVFK